MVDVQDLFEKLITGARVCKDGRRTTTAKHKDNKNNPTTTVPALDFFGEQEVELAQHTSVNSNHNLLAQTSISTAKSNKRKRKASVEDSLPSENDGHSDAKRHNKESKAVTAERKEEIRREKVNRLRNESSIQVRGADIPDPIASFVDLRQRYKCPAYICQNLSDSGFETPTAVQMQAIPLMLNHREILVCAPTGSGKTLAFIIPILQSLQRPRRDGFRAVIVSPTRELANQIYSEFNRLSAGKGFRVHVLTKSKAASRNFVNKTTKRYDILITTPNRLVYLLRQEPPQISLDKVEWLVLDEGDKLFEAGENGFKEQIAAIFQACSKPDIKRALFSATLANDVEQWCSLHLDNFVRVLVGVRNAATEAVRQELKFVGQESGKLLAVRELLRKGFSPPILVFVQSKERAKELFNELIYDGINVDVIHADRTQAQRDNIVKCFRTGKVWVLIATELMGRGIDFKGVNLVVNYDFPTSAVSYIHRIGRTGRAGRPGTAVTFFTEEDTVNLRSIASVMLTSGCEIPSWICDLKKPDRSTRRKLKKMPVERESIASLTRIDKKKKEIKKKRKEQLEANQKTNRVGGKSRTTNKRREKAQKKGTKDKDVGKWKG